MTWYPRRRGVYLQTARIPVKTIEASVFEGSCLEILDEITETGEPVIISRNGKPFCKLVPYVRKPKSLFGLHRGIIKSHDDLVSSDAIVWDTGY